MNVRNHSRVWIRKPIVVDLLKHRRQEEIDESSDDDCHLGQGYEYRHYAPAQMQFAEVELN